ncbi:Ankyrin repeat domain-containing protein, partial [Tetrabaena socialis]
MERQQKGRRQGTWPPTESREQPEAAAPPQQQFGGADAVATDDPSCIWLPELVQRFTGCLTCNEVACALRLVNKATARQLSRPQYRTVRLSLPVPHQEFAWRWSGTGAMRSLNRLQRKKLTCLTASSGSIANLEVLLAGDSERMTLEGPVLTAAAAAGQLEVCRWLRLQGCPYGMYGYDVLGAAATGGYQALYEWQLADGCPTHPDGALAARLAAVKAASGGHVGLMDWLLGSVPIPRVPDLLQGAAAGVDLPTLQRLHQTYACGSGEGLGREERLAVLAAAAASPTADWRAKVEWLEGRGCPQTAGTCARAAGLPDGQARLEWLRQRGYPLSAEVAVEAARGGNVDALQYVLAEGVQIDARSAQWAASGAALDGHLAVLQALLHAPGVGVPALRSAGAAPAAATNGHTPVVVRLAEVLGAAEVLTVEVAERAARSGSMELLAWLHAHGCPWGASVFAAAARGGSEEQLEWLEAHGCPMGEDGEPYQHALANADLPVLRCLRRLGCPWGPCGRTFMRAIGTYNRERSGNRQPAASLRTVRWLLEEGCPHFAGCLTCNEVACVLRLINKAAAAQFSRPQDRIVRLSLPVPHRAFVWRWSGMGAMRSLNRSQRRQLTCLTARSGSIANLEVLLAGDNKRTIMEGPELTAAAAAGQLEVCRWLRLQGCPYGMYGYDALGAAVKGGHQAVYEWLLAADSCPLRSDAALAAGWAAIQAAGSGQVGLVDWLLGSARIPHAPGLLEAAAVGVDLPTLQRLHQTYACGSGEGLGREERLGVLAAAAASPTADWRAKVEWLEGQGCARTADTCVRAAELPDGQARLEWLRHRGYPLSAGVAVEAARGGNVDALQYVLAEGVQVDARSAQRAASGAALDGHLAVLQALLHAPGFGIPALRSADAALNAAHNGHTPVVVWLAEVLGAAKVLTVEVAECAASSGSMELLVWLHAHGCPWGASVFAAAARGGSEEQLEWLVAHGCPMGHALAYGELPVLRCLRRLGCPWGPCGRTFTRAIGTYNRERSGNRQPTALLRTLGWLLEEGCPVDWDEAMREQQFGGADAVAADDLSRIWLPELVQRFAGCLAPNEVACILRLVNKATTTQFSRPQDRTVRLSLPVPHHAFVWRWSGMGAMRSLNRLQRRQLPCLTARSGSVANLEVLLAGDSEGMTLEGPVLTAAAAAGQLEVCRWLRLHGCQYSHDVLGEAAKGGHQAVYEWLLADGCPTHPDGLRAAGWAAAQAAGGGQVGLMDWLLGSDRIPHVPGLLEGAAAGVDLPTLQRLHHTHTYGFCESLDREERLAVLAAAAASPTADWRAKVEWLEGQGFSRTAATCARAAGLPDGRARLEWLRQRGYPLSAEVAVDAASGGNVDALQYVLAEGAQIDAWSARRAASGAALGGHLAVLQALLHAPGFGIPALRSASVAPAAATNGHMPVVVWLADVLGAAEVLTVEVAGRAAGSGSMELLVWLHAHGCPWGASAFAAAAEWGSEEQLEWLVAHGCPMGEDGEPYQRALANADLPVLRCLRRLGCPWGPCGRTFMRAIGTYNRERSGNRQPAALLRTLGLLLEEGCPVDWDEAMREAWCDPGLQTCAPACMERQQKGERQGTWPPTEPREQPEAAAPQPQQQFGGAEAVDADDPSRIWLPELVQRFAGCLAPNEVACVLRLVNKATTTQFSRPQYRTVRLSLPVPHHAFVWR